MSKLAAMQARFQQKQMQEKEEKLIKLYENQQQRTIERIGARGALSGGASPVTGTGTGTGKVRQMFDERRQKAGIDRSYPLEPLNKTRNGYSNSINNRVPNTDRPANGVPRNNNIKSTSTFKTTVQRTITQSKNGKPPTTYGARATAEANYINGELKSGNIQYDITDNGNPLDILKNQEKQLEIMMKNHRIDDEEFVDCSMDFDEDRGDHPRIMENGKENGNRLENGNYKKSISPPVTSPIKKPQRPPYGLNKEKTSEKIKPLTKTQSSPAKTTSPQNYTLSSSRPQSSSGYQNKEKPQMRSANTRPSVGSRPLANSQQRSSGSVRGNTSGISQPQRDDLKSCQYCQRRFATDRIALHEDICAKTLKKKRKIYDPIKHRVQGTDAESYYRKGGKAASTKVGAQKAPSIGKSDWRRQHEEFISAIRAAKQAQAHIARGGKLSDLPPPPPSYNPDYIQCPHCGRRFNEAAAARHIPKCATMLHNKPNRLTGMQNQKKK